MVRVDMVQGRPNLPTIGGEASETEVMGAYDAIDGAPVYVIADVALNDAWIAVDAGHAEELEDHR